MPSSRRQSPAGGGELVTQPESATDGQAPAADLAKLDPIDREIVRLKYSNRALSHADIGKLLVPPISKQAITSRIAAHGLTQVLEALGGDVVSAYKSHQIAAVGVVASTMNGNNKSWLAFQAAMFFLQGLVGSKLALPDEVLVDDVIFEDSNAPPPPPKKKPVKK